MALSPVQTLLAAVRRRLWRGQFVAALRLAAWGSASLAVLAVGLQLTVRQVPPAALVLASGALWALLLARAAWRRPTPAACALWADRHLGGASAYSTLLDADRGAAGGQDALALRHVADWATRQAPQGLRQLAARREPLQFARPLLACLVCAPLAGFVLTQPDHALPAPAAQAPDTAARVADGAGASAPPVQPLESAELVREIEAALRPAPPLEGAEPAGAGRAPQAGTGQAGDAPLTAVARPDAAAVPGLAADDRPGAATALDTAPRAGGAQTSAAAAGRDAGDSRDERADVGVRRVPPGAKSMQRSAAAGQAALPARRADRDQAARYDDDLSMPGAAATLASTRPAAAAPPTATAAARLSPTETSYVQAWMKARARQP